MISEFEKQQALSQTKSLSDWMFEDPQRGQLFHKVLTHYVQNTMPSNQAERLLEGTASDLAEMKHQLANLMKHIIVVASEGKTFGKMYSTGQLATFFGVSITTINNWIQEGRFVDVERTAKNKQLRISEYTKWITPMGTTFLVKDVVKLYELEEQARAALPYQDEGEEGLLENVQFFEEKYGGTYQETLALLEHHTLEQDRDAHEWRYLLKMLGKGVD